MPGGSAYRTRKVALLRVTGFGRGWVLSGGAGALAIYPGGLEGADGDEGPDGGWGGEGAVGGWPLHYRSSCCVCLGWEWGVADTGVWCI